MLMRATISASMLFKSALIFLACSIAVVAQTSTSNPQRPNDPPGVDKPSSSSDSFGSMEEEMRKRREIKYAEKQYKENLDRAREAAEIGVQLRDAYERHKSLSPDETKKLERLEKLTKKIRSEAGGSDEDATLDDPPNGLQSALSRLAEVSQSLRKVVEKTPRQVVSAAVIEQSNAVLQLLKLARGFLH
jgi:hypothetical protein